MKIDKFKVEEWFDKYEKTALYNFADTCVESLSVRELLKICEKKENSLDRLYEIKLNYGDIQGSSRLKSGIISLYENQIQDNITVTHGTIGANQLVMLSLIEPEDKVVSIIPTYQQHYAIAKSFGANLKTVRLKPENNWLPDLEELEKVVQTDTKLICLNNPNNPTGALIPDEMLQQIVKIASKSGAYILCDEVYRGLNHEGKHFSKSIVDIYDRGISTSSMSKVFSLAGLRLGWIAANTEIIKKIITQRQYNTISVGILDDYFASIALENKDKIIQRNLKKILTGKKILEDFVKAHSKLTMVNPQAGTTAFVQYDLNVKSTELCKDLQQKTSVMILPGETFEYENFLRIGYGNNEIILKKGLELFSEFLKNYG